MGNMLHDALLVLCALYIFVYQARDAHEQNGLQLLKTITGAIGFAGHYAVFAGALMLGASPWWPRGCDYGGASLIVGMALRRWYLERVKQAGGVVA